MSVGTRKSVQLGSLEATESNNPPWEQPVFFHNCLSRPLGMNKPLLPLFLQRRNSHHVPGTGDRVIKVSSLMVLRFPQEDRQHKQINREFSAGQDKCYGEKSCFLCAVAALSYWKTATFRACSVPGSLPQRLQPFWTTLASREPPEGGLKPLGCGQAEKYPTGSPSPSPGPRVSVGFRRHSWLCHLWPWQSLPTPDSSSAHRQ